VCTPGVFSRVYPCSVGLENYGKEALSSEELCFLSGLADGWWMLKSPTTRIGKGVKGRARAGATVLSVMVLPHTLWQLIRWNLSTVVPKRERAAISRVAISDLPVKIGVMVVIPIRDLKT